MRTALIGLLLLGICTTEKSYAQTTSPTFHYSISVADPGSHRYNVILTTEGWVNDSVTFRLPQWMPGYYQILAYENNIQKIEAMDTKGRVLPLEKTGTAAWTVTGTSQKKFTLRYEILTNRQFVANSYVDSAHAYLVSTNTFLYVDGYLQQPVTVNLTLPKEWESISGLDQRPGKTHFFSAPNFDILYDCPILGGKLVHFPSYTVRGVPHHFVAYNTGSFDPAPMIEGLRRITEAAYELMGDIPFKEYTFIGIGPGRGGIEHLNNTTVSFTGTGLEKPENLNRMLNFLAHEYFHHYNAKRIRPVELGPFDYSGINRTDQLWISEGLTVYYEYLLMRRAGLATEEELISNLEKHINAVENNPGRFYQTLAQSSYHTWRDGPFGDQGQEKGKTINYYDKGPVVGFLLDLAIREATENQQSLDDVMRALYTEYYKKKGRGFTGPEFQALCEKIAAKPLPDLYNYIYTTKELDYSKFFNMAGLKLEKQEGEPAHYKIRKSELLNDLQETINNSILGAQSYK